MVPALLLNRARGQYHQCCDMRYSRFAWYKRLRIRLLAPFPQSGNKTMAIGTFLVALDMMWLLANMPDSPVAELINTLPNAIGLVFGIVLLPGDVVYAAQLLIRMNDDQQLLPFRKVCTGGASCL